MTHCHICFLSYGKRLRPARFIVSFNIYPHQSMRQRVTTNRILLLLREREVIRRERVIEIVQDK
uniref:Putative ovule protein n=1 Tax=Solanum chacoense TaxID=4108 RepID=A0A0V0HGG1_SOLCH